MHGVADTITPQRIEQTSKALDGYIRRTPVADIDGIALKLESMQHAGSFKTRGAFANLLSREIPRAGVVAASGGNHGAAVAYAAMRLRIPCTIFVPTVSSPAKIARIREYGAQLEIVGDRYSDAFEASERYARTSQALNVHAYDRIETVLGQGTIGLEIERLHGSVDTVIAAVGGGGLIGGISAWYAGRVKIVAVEPEGAPTLAHALAAGVPVDAPAGSVARDSLAPKRIGDLTFEIARRYVNRSVLVSDDDIIAAREALWDRARVIAEPGGSAAFAALLSGKYAPQPDERVIAIVSGANTVISWT
ncbi:MAG: threonine/serine dehydratase [Candidatus Eremiobacteraeota bacterium]|nr:threonine/serine dehydratase [Candidatus Eremiobacteraeota bacterium]